MPRVSVIIPNYNHAPYLKQRIDAVLNQSYQDFEMIILDDCSTDNSREIIESYRENEKIVCIEYNSVNSKSTFRQWYKGLSHANGELIWIAESDDWTDCRFLECMIKYLKEERVVLAYAQSYIGDENSKIKGENYSWTSDFKEDLWHRDFIKEGTELLPYLAVKNIIPNISGVLFRKSAFPEENGFPFNLKMTGDWWLYIYWAKSYKIAYCSQCLNYFRETNQSSRIHNSPEKKRQRIKEGLFILKQFDEVPSVTALVRAQANKYLKLWETLGTYDEARSFLEIRKSWDFSFVRLLFLYFLKLKLIILRRILSKILRRIKVLHLFRQNIPKIDNKQDLL